MHGDNPKCDQLSSSEVGCVTENYRSSVVVTGDSQPMGEVQAGQKPPGLCQLIWAERLALWYVRALLFRWRAEVTHLCDISTLLCSSWNSQERLTQMPTAQLLRLQPQLAAWANSMSATLQSGEGPTQCPLAKGGIQSSSSSLMGKPCHAGMWFSMEYLVAKKSNWLN